MMSDENKRLLEEKCPTLMKTLDLQSSPLLAHLVSKGAITTEQKEFILNKDQGANFKQVETLVETLLRKGDKEVESFFKCLEDSGHSGVANELRSSCTEEGPSSACAAVCDRQDKTVSVKAEICVKSNSSAEPEETTETKGLDNNPIVTPDTEGTLAEERCEPLSPSGSEPEENDGEDTHEAHSSATADKRKNREEGKVLSESVLLNAFQENIVGILEKNVEELERGHLDKADILPILVRLSSVHKKVIAVFQGSILFIVRCPSLEALYDLKEALASGSLRDSFIRTFFTPERMTTFGILEADVDISLDEMEYIQCERELKAAGDEIAVDRLVQTHGHAYSADSQWGQFHPEGICTPGREVEDASGETPMTDSHKERISRCYNWIADQVQDEQIVEQLLSENILTEYDRQLIREKSVPANRVGKLFDTILQKPDCAFYGLVGALKNTERHDLARLLTRKKKSMHLAVKLKRFKTRHSTTTKVARRRFLKDIVRFMEEHWQEVSIRGTMVHGMGGTRFFQELLKMGTIAGFGMGCIYVALILSSLEALENLIGTISKETLQNAFMDTYFTPDLLEKHGVESADIEMSISSPEYEMCKEELIEEGMQTKMDKLDIQGDVERRLDEPAQEEESRHHSPASKRGSQRLEKSKVKDTGPWEKLRNVFWELAGSALGATKVSRDPEKHMLEYHKGCIRQLDASQLEVGTVIDRLQAVGLFTQPDVRDIMQLEDQEKATRLLELIITAPDRAFDELVNALLETGQRDLAIRLVDSEYEEIRKGVHRDDQFLTGEACKPVETTVKHKRGHIYRFIGPRLSRFYLPSYTSLWEHEVTRRAPYQATSPQLELVEGGRRRKDNIYATNHKRRGKALIFVDQWYSRLTGGHAEQDALVGPLQDLGFDVESYLPDKTTTLSTGFIVDKLRTVAKEDHTDADCFLCVAVCYRGRLGGYELLHPLGSDKCPSLAGKPKIFIIQGLGLGLHSCVLPEPDYLILQSSWRPLHHGFDELLATAFIEMINKNGEEDFVHVCVEVTRARLERLMKVGMSGLLEYNSVATSFTKDLYLLPAQESSSSKTGTETHQKGKQRYLHSDPFTSQQEQFVATSSTKGVYLPEQQTESWGLVKQSKEKVAGEEDT